MKSPFILLCSQFAAQSTVVNTFWRSIFSMNHCLFVLIQDSLLIPIVWSSDLPSKGVFGTLQLCNVANFALTSQNFMESGDYRGSLYVNFHHMIWLNTSDSLGHQQSQWVPNFIPKLHEYWGYVFLNATSEIISSHCAKKYLSGICLRTCIVSE